MAANEWWDLYTKERQLTGARHLRGEPLNPGEYHLVVHVCIFNSENQLLIQQRQPWKRGWRNMWDVSIGGSALAGESSGQAAERETLEELGLKLKLDRPCFTVNFPEGFDDYYLVKEDVEISELKLQKEEVRRVRWVDKEEALRMQEEGTMIPYWFLDKLFDAGAYRGAHGKYCDEIKIVCAEEKNLASWMSLAEIVRQNFPGLETEEKLENYRRTVLKNMERGSAVCALDGNVVVGILLFSERKNMLSCLAVHPEYRRRGIATALIARMLERLDRSRDIVVETFREEDEKGIAARALYRSLGFVPEGTCLFEGSYPVQRFVLRGKNAAESCRNGQDTEQQGGGSEWDRKRKL